jgi:hypothetical protein
VEINNLEKYYETLADYFEDGIIINSLHHQMLIPNEKGVVLGHCAIQTPGLGENDETVWFSHVPETVYYPESNAICFQFHPEMLYDDSEGVIYSLICVKTLLGFEFELKNNNKFDDSNEDLKELPMPYKYPIPKNTFISGTYTTPTEIGNVSTNDVIKNQFSVTAEQYVDAMMQMQLNSSEIKLKQDDDFIKLYWQNPSYEELKNKSTES